MYKIYMSNYKTLKKETTKELKKKRKKDSLRSWIRRLNIKMQFFPISSIEPQNFSQNLKLFF